MWLYTGAGLQLSCVIITCLLTFGARAQVDNDVRLVDGPNPYEGRVEIFKDGVWLSVCRSFVSSYSFGGVVCRQAGYPSNGALLYYANSYGPAPGEILKKYINCNGQETSLSNCSFSPSDQNCDPRYTLGVSCDTGLSEVQTVRLVNGTSQYEGRVEVFKSGVWGIIIEQYTDNVQPFIAANIICRTLFGSSYGGSVVPTQEAALRFGIIRRRPIHMTSPGCKGNEQSLLNCSYSIGRYETLEYSLAVVCKQVPEGCNGYVAALTGTITSPGFPEGAVYVNDTDCVWKIVNKGGTLQLSFTNLQINTSLTASKNVLQVIDSNSYSTLAYVQNPVTLGTLQSSGNELYVWLRAQSGTRGIQFQASWVPPCSQRLTGSYIETMSPDYPNQYPPNLNCTFKIVKRKGALLRFTFYTFTLGAQQNGVCQDALEIFDGDSFTSPSVGGPLCGTTRPSDLTTSNQTTTTVLVRFTSDAVNTSLEQAFYFSSYQIEPDPIRPGNYTQDSGSFKTPGYPNVYNGEENVIWTITTKPYKTITLSFQDVQLLECCLNYILVTDDTGGSSMPIYGPETTSTIVTDVNSVYIILMSSLDNGLNKFRASWTTECRQVFKNDNGIIISPNDPEFNTSSANCTYIIRQQPGYYIRIQFSSITFERDARCRNFIEIHDGSTEYDPLLGEKYCGLSLPSPLNSTQNMVFMKFSTQTGYNNFSLTYSSHQKALSVCQGNDCDAVNGGCVLETYGETCFCNSGYYLLSDGVSCSRIPVSETTQEVTTNSSTQEVTTDSSTQERTSQNVGNTPELSTAISSRTTTSVIGGTLLGVVAAAAMLMIVELKL